MIAVAAITLVTITVILLVLIEQSNQEQVYAQNQTQSTNFTQLFSTDKAFLLCGDPVPYTAGCLQPIEVLYQDSNLLVLSSDYIDVMWKGVAQGQKEGYQIDSMTSYLITDPTSGSPNVNLLVAMSK
jgi:hypothetical protein